MDSGVPQASNRAGSRPGGGVKPPTGQGGAAKSNGTPRPGPIDPRKEDPNSPPGLSRAGKTVGRRRPGILAQRPSHQAPGSVDAPVEFAVGTPLSPAPVDTPAAKRSDTVADEVAAPAALAPTIEVTPPVASPSPNDLAPTAWAPMTTAQTNLVPTSLVPSTLVPTELIPRELHTEAIPAPILYDEAATIDDVTQIGPVLDSRPLRRPVQFRRAPKPRIRRVTRVVRHVDTWSVFKVALVFNVFFYAVAMVAGVLLWQVAYATGTIDNVEKFFEGFGWETFNFNGGQIFHNAWIAGLFVAIGLTGLAVLLAALFNLITDLVGGVRFSVLEEEVRTRAERGTELLAYDTGSTVLDPNVEAVDPPDSGLGATDSADEAIAG